MKNEALRESLITQAEDSCLELLKQVDCLFDLAAFFLERYPENTPSMIYKIKELNETVKLMAAASSQLAEVIKRWKHCEQQVLSAFGTETTILNELWANIQAMLYFLTTHNIDPAPFNALAAIQSYRTLQRCNRLLS